MTTDEARKLIDRCLESEKINNLQELILLQSWQNKTYQEIAANSGYTDDYIRENGAKLWQLLSQAFNEKINKKNFKAVLERHCRQQSPTTNNHRDWQEASDLTFFCGRNQELATVEQWIVGDRCRLIGIFGMGGMGKTSLAVKLAEQTASEFDYLIWRSLRNAPPLDRLLAGIVQFLAQQQTTELNLPQDIDNSVSNLIENLHSHRCLLVIDNAETILQAGNTCGSYRSGYERCGELIRRIGEIAHQSCVILTSREKLREFIALEGNKLPVRSLQIKGVGAEISKEICQFKGELRGAEQDWQTLDRNYSGNPLALKIVTTTIQELFDGDLNSFLQQEILFFDDIENLFTEQLNRLSKLEREIMYLLAFERKPVPLKRLRQDLMSSTPKKQIFEAVKSLQRRSLIEKSADGFSQQP